MARSKGDTMNRILVPAIALIIGLTLGLGASAVAGPGKRLVSPACLAEKTGTCYTVQLWCATLKRTKLSRINDETMRHMLNSWRATCRYVGPSS
jgi:hypothetical protein